MISAMHRAPDTLERTRIRAAVSFYPLLTDLPDEQQVLGMLALLEDPTSFGTPFPVPSSAVDDAQFDPNALWKGKRHNCPWNGRVWPMTNSHIVHGLIRQWRLGHRAVGPAAGRLLRRFVHLLFHDGDLERPNCFEHYNPYTGQASVYRGIDDYQHSWVLDLILRGVMGIHPTTTGLTVDPLPMELDHAVVGLRLRGRAVLVERRGDAVRVRLDDCDRETTVGRPVELAW